MCFAIAVDSQVCRKNEEGGPIQKTKTILLDIYRNLRQSPNSGLAVKTVVTFKQMLEDNHGNVRISMPGRRGYLRIYYLNANLVMFMSQTPSTTNLNGPLRGYSIEYKEEGKSSWTTVNDSDSSTDKTLQSLKKWTVHFIRIAVSNGNFLGPPGPEKQVRTLEDGLYTPKQEINDKKKTNKQTNKKQKGCN